MVELKENELLEISAGNSYHALMAVSAGTKITSVVCGAIVSDAGATSVAALAASGPVGWACIGVGVTGALITSAIATKAWNM